MSVSCPAGGLSLLTYLHAAAPCVPTSPERTKIRPARPAPGSHGMLLPHAMYGRSPFAPFVQGLARLRPRRPCGRAQAASQSTIAASRFSDRNDGAGNPPRQAVQRATREVRVAGHVRPEGQFGNPQVDDLRRRKPYLAPLQPLPRVRRQLRPERFALSNACLLKMRTPIRSPASSFGMGDTTGAPPRNTPPVSFP